MSLVSDLFPPCSDSMCPQAGSIHKHILPLQQEFLDSTEKFIALIGGYGSGKTLPICIMGHLLSVSIPGNRGIVLRRSLPKLHDSTERIYLEVLKRSGVSYVQRENRDGWPHRLIYANGSEVVFRETTDLGRFLGPEYGWFYIDEAQEEPEKTFKDLVGRLRLPRASKYLRGMIATNPPSSQHWIAQTWPKVGTTKKTVVVRGKPITSTFRMIRSSTVDNPHLDAQYIAGLMTTHTAAEVKRIIQGNYGFSADGRPVYPKFDELKHLADPPCYPMTIFRTWDFGYRMPAVTWSQIYKCKESSWHMNVLYELESPSIETENLADQVLDITSKVFPEPARHMIIDGGDTAGAQVNEKGPGPIIRLARPKTEGGRNLRIRHRKFGDIDPGLEAVRNILGTKCKCGFHLLTIHRRCTWLTEALAGGYHFPKEIVGKDNQAKPVKDGYYDNIADSLRYAVMLFYEPMSKGLEVDWVSEAAEGMSQTADLDDAPNWGWMGA